jgi:hypothetical protein
VGYEGAVVLDGLGDGREKAFVETIFKYFISVQDGEFLGYLSD